MGHPTLTMLLLSIVLMNRALQEEFVLNENKRKANMVLLRSLGVFFGELERGIPWLVGMHLFPRAVKNPCIKVQACRY